MRVRSPHHFSFGRSLVEVALAIFLLFAARPLFAAEPALPAPIRLHPSNPRIFEFRGKPTVLVSSGEHYGAVVNLDFDYARYLEILAAEGLNYTRIFTGAYVEFPGAFGIEHNTLAPAPERFIAPWARSAEPGYTGGGNRFDLSRWDEAYFARLNDFVRLAGSRGIVVEVTLFSSLYNEKGWDMSPFNAKNNVNGVGALSDWKKVHTLDNGNLLHEQERLVRKLVSELAQHDNVFFEIQNEPWADQPRYPGNNTPASLASLAWQRRIAAVLHEAAPAARRPLIAQNIANRTQRIDGPDPLVSIFNFHYASPPDGLAENAHVHGVLGFDESGFDGADDGTYRAQAWHFVLGGGGLFNNLDYGFTVGKEDGTAKQKAPGGGSPALRAQLGYLSRFVHGFGAALPAMRPGQGFIKGGAPGSVRALSAHGRAYAIYLGPDATSDPAIEALYRRLGAGDKQVKQPALLLDLPYGRYDFEWVDPVARQSLSRGTLVHVEGVARIELPARAGELALRVVRAAAEPELDTLVAPRAPEGLVSITSPGGQVRVTLLHADLGGLDGYPSGRRPYFRVEHAQVTAAPSQKGGKRSVGPYTVVLPWSPLGLVRADANFVDGLTVVSRTTRTVNDSYRLLSGKALQHTTRATEGTLILRGTNGERLALDIRAYDDGAAVRHRFIDEKPGLFEVVREETGFRLPQEARAFLTEHDEATEWHPAYENTWRLDLPVGTPSEKRAGWSFPALFRIGTRWALLTESDLDRNYFGARLSAEAPGGLYRIRLPDVREGEGIAPAAPRAGLPWTMPWRVFIVGEGLAPIVESNLVTHLARPSQVKDTSWIKPGRSSWSWWSESESPKQYERLRDFVDLASEMGWEYSLVDANWDLMQGGDWKALAAYAREKKVRLWLWYNSGGRHNIVRERPRDRMDDRARRRAEFKAISEAGIAGVKVDFFQSDKQARIDQYLSILEDAAEFKLLVNFHGCTLPRGWSRTFPNLMAHEAVKGGEVYKFGRDFPAQAPAHNTVLVFTRNVVGPMDYTPVAFSDSRFAHVTTNAHELALSVVFESGILHMADAADSYRALPPAPKAFLKEVPVAWDETRLVDGYPGKLAVLARRRGQTWYLAGINGEAQGKMLELPLGFLGAGRYTAQIIGDGASDRAFSERTAVHSATDQLRVELRGNGGFVARFSPVGR